VFGVTIIGCLIFRQMLARLNKELEEAEHVENANPDVDHMDNPDEALRMIKGFRYIL
jgi:hypothetical protein